MAFVSMSWRLPQPVQACLDAQLCRPQIDRLICVLKQKQTAFRHRILILAKNRPRFAMRPAMDAPLLACRRPECSARFKV
jgi:hypothetical protein